MQVRIVSTKHLTWWQKLGITVGVAVLLVVALFFFAIFAAFFALTLLVASVWLAWRRWRLRGRRGLNEDGTIRAEYREIRRRQEYLPREQDSDE
ncbi:hypothetical protein [Acidithiobacillus sp. AMEEHan]|uniref:hypothetical protein n=1 Tax=Acidithiobacillus sp. AMEEHan TaxID=2994951 RepID=UPI0027E478E2|nr:hypothetical protein [Acidithiobacillus sp. AMEEHan]